MNASSPLNALKSPILFHGDDHTAYRDPAVWFDGKIFYLFCTLVEVTEEGPFLYTIESTSPDLLHWTEPVKLTPKDSRLNFSSPGCILPHDGRYCLCLQTYCRENGEKYGNRRSRPYVMKSSDLIHWDEPELLKVKGDIPEEDMGRIIDPYLVRDRKDPHQIYCLYKQNGVSISRSTDLLHWEYLGQTECGENVCVLPYQDHYRIFHSPRNGIGILETDDFRHFTALPDVIRLGQDHWPWAQGRITAGFVLDLTKHPDFQCYLMFFHGSGPEDEKTMFDDHASIGLAWSDNLQNWHYPE